MDILMGGPIPPLRADLDLAPLEHEGQSLVIVKDLLGLEPETRAVPMAAIVIASLFDGRKKAADVRDELARQGMTVTDAEVQALADQLNRHGLLETPAAAEQRRRQLQAFRDSGVRRFSPKARGLPEHPLELGAFLGKFHQDPKGPGAASGDDGKDPALGVVAPHIDFFRGGPLYAWSYGALAGSRPPDVIVALGVAHLSPRSPWVMTRKAYETPFGPMEVDEALYRDIAGALWYDPLEEEWVHAQEHSLEFQAVWLKHLWRDKAPKWVPILCSAYERYCSDAAPSSAPSVEKALKEIGRILTDAKKAGRRVMVLAGVDLAHVGRRFGDDLDVTEEVKKKVEAADRACLEDALALNADAFFLSGVGEGEWRKVCGLSALYTALRWIRDLSGGNGVRGKLLAYDQAPDPAGGTVSFASAVFE